jgi:hypothetical protein
MEGYRERLTAPPSWWIAAALFGGTCGWIMVVAANLTWGLAAAAVAFLAAAALVGTYGGLLVSAGQDGLHVGSAFLPNEFVGSASALDRVSFRASIGPEADARAWLRTRPYVDGGVRVAVTDPADPTPYWLVSCRRPEAVVAALGHPVGQTCSARNEGNAE